MWHVLAILILWAKKFKDPAHLCFCARVFLFSQYLQRFFTLPK